MSCMKARGQPVVSGHIVDIKLNRVVIKEETKETARCSDLSCHLTRSSDHWVSGYARRYFILRNNGTLSYSLNRGQEYRDQILLNNAAFSSSPTNRSIHVDSGTATFHLRALNETDYQNWMCSLRYLLSSICGLPLWLAAVGPSSPRRGLWPPWTQRCDNH